MREILHVEMKGGECTKPHFYSLYVKANLCRVHVQVSVNVLATKPPYYGKFNVRTHLKHQISKRRIESREFMPIDANYFLLKKVLCIGLLN